MNQKSLFNIPAQKTKNISYSTINIYNECPFRYKLTFIDQIMKGKRIPRFYLTVGAILHLALQDFFSLKKEKRNKETIADIFRKRWRWYSEDKEEEIFYFEKCLEILKDYCKCFDLKSDIFSLEKGFKIKFDNNYLIGKFDRIDKLKNGKYEIIDYKFGENEGKTAEEMKDNLQWIVYWYAFLQKYNNLLVPKKVSFHFLGACKNSSFCPTEKDFQKGLKKLRDTIKAMNYSKKYAKQIGRWCNDCYFKDKECKQ